jgi:hypothetical protein
MGQFLAMDAILNISQCRRALIDANLVKKGTYAFGNMMWTYLIDNSLQYNYE